MTRKEMYSKIKEYAGLAEAIKEKTGKNFTLVSNSELEDFINDYEEKSKKPKICLKKKTPECNKNLSVFEKLMNVLKGKGIIIDKEYDFIMK